MAKDVKLYINNQLIEFKSSPDILFTYQEDDLTNPTIVKNSYTKTITIPGTKQNDIIFDGIWNVQRIQTEENFNVTKRVPFTLYVNGDVYQTGYAKLDRVNFQFNKYEYNITLYGGLGSFLYNLSIDWNTGEKRTLADLNYYEWPEASEPLDLGFTINKDTVASAWTEVSSNGKWSVVNFAPTYIGHPDVIDCDKVLINFSGSSLTSAVTSGGSTYSSTGGYALGTLPQELTSEEVRDYRSYIQTPVIRVKNVIEAICRPENNSGRYDEGYEVDLDTDFFTPSNPYYYDAWVTLPTITNLEFSSEGGGGETTAYTANPINSYYDIEGNSIYTFALDSPITGGNISVKATIDLGVTGSSSSDNLYFYYTRYKGRTTKVYYRNAYGIQLYASNSITSNENILAGSNVKWLSGEQRFTYSDAVVTGQFTPKWNTNVVENHTGYFTKVSGSTYHFDGLLELYCDLPIGTRYFKLFIKRCNSSNSSERNMLFTSTAGNTGDKISVRPLPFVSKDIELSEIDSGESISNKYISKEMLLATSYSPCDWLLSYLKKFGLYIYKDKVENKIYIKTRNNYYLRDEVLDIDKDIDYSKQYSINPVYCENGYLSLTDSADESKYIKDYTQKYGKVYGQKIVVTGYEFNADTKELNNGVFKGAIQAKDVSQYYYKPNSMNLQAYTCNGMSYLLYENGNYSGNTYEYVMAKNDISQVFQPFNENYPNYDLVSKPMFTDDDGRSLDTESVLLFFNGYENVSGFKWYLTDDLAYMYKLNNNPTWLLTVGEYDSSGNKIANEITQFPRFSRWYEGNKWMIYSFDYGSPRALYVPDFLNNEEGNIYWNYFKKYYEDLYDVDTKVVDCYVLGRFDDESLRRFYWFNDTTWRLNKITDYNPTNHDTTKAQFVKVQNLEDMTNEEATTDVRIWITLDRYYLEQSGGTLIGTVKTSDNYGWNFENYSVEPYDSAYTITESPSSYGSTGNFGITGGTNNDEDKKVTLIFTAGDIGGSVSFFHIGAISTFSCPEDELWFTAESEKKEIALTNPYGCAWEVVARPNWILTTPKGENTGSTLYIRAFDNYENEERSGVVVVWDKYHDVTYTIPVNQMLPNPILTVNPTAVTFIETGGTICVDVESNISWNVKISGETEVTAITFSGLTWVGDIPASGGTANKNNCTYSIIGTYSDGTSGDVTSSSSVSGSASVSASTATTRHSAGTLTLTATYDTLSASSSVTIYQAAAEVPTGVTAISLDNAVMVNDIPASGIPQSGYTVNSADCSFTITGYYADGTTEDLTNIADCFGSATIFCSDNTGTTRRNVGTLTLQAHYQGLFDYATLQVYQAAAEQPQPITGNYLTFNIISSGTINWYLDRYVSRTLQYSKNGGEWTNLASSDPAAIINVVSGDTVMFKGSNTTLNGSSFSGSTAYYNLSGNIMSLLYDTDFENHYTFENGGVFDNLFAETYVVDASNLILPATALTSNCYLGMFYNCTNLETAPSLSAQTLVQGCYLGMFQYCEKLNYIRCLATAVTYSQYGPTSFWVDGVASAGTFVKASGMTGWTINSDSGVPIGWTVVEDGQNYTWQAYNRSEWNVYGNLHTGSTQDYAGLEVHSGETEDHNEAVPVTLTSAYLALSPAPPNPENYSIVLSNSTYGDSMVCAYDALGANNAWVGTGSVRLEQGTILDIAVVQL